MEKRLDDRMRWISPAAWPDLLAGIAEVDEFKGWWRGRYDPPPPHLARLRKSAVALSAAASTGIGWIGLPPPRGGQEPVLPRAEEERRRREEAACYANLLKRIFDGYAGMPLATEALLSFHGELMRYSRMDRGPRGAFRSVPDRRAFLPRPTLEAIALRPSDPEAVPGEMDALIRWTNARLAAGEFHPLLVVAAFVLEFLAIRPFAAGNGRTSRLLTNLLLLRSGYAYMPYGSLEKAIASRKAEYYLALRKSQSQRHLARPEAGSWPIAFLGALRDQARELKGFLERRPRETVFSANQANALGLLDRHRELTNRLVAAELGLSRETAKQVLNRLVALDALARRGAGRAVRYVRAEGE